MPLEDFESACVVVAPLLVVGDVPVVWVVVSHANILLRRVLLVGVLSFEVFTQGTIVEVDSLEFAVGIEAEDQTERVVDKADDCNDVLYLFLAG